MNFWHLNLEILFFFAANEIVKVLSFVGGARDQKVPSPRLKIRFW